MRRDPWITALLVLLAAVAVGACVATLASDGFSLTWAGRRVLSIHSPVRVWLAAVLALSALGWRLRGNRAAGERTGRTASPGLNWTFSTLMLIAAGLGLSGPPVEHGDAREYIIQTQSIALHGQLRIDCDRIRPYWNANNPFGETLAGTAPPRSDLRESNQAGGGFGGLYADRHGDYRYYHFWLYSLAVAPLYALLHLLAPGTPLEFSAFRIMNVLFLLAPFALAWRRWASGRTLAVTALALVSPLIPYVDWAHPELFCFALVAVAFLLSESARRRWVGPLLIGLGASQNVPIALFLAPHAVRAWTVARPATLREAWRVVWPYGAGAIVSQGATAYFLGTFGVPNVIAVLGLADPAYATAARAALIFICPLIGAVWFYPAWFAFIPAAVRRRDLAWGAVLLATMAGAAWLCGATRNFNAGQVGAPRYAVWLVAPLLAFVLARVGDRTVAFAAWRRAAFFAGCGLTLAAIVFFHLYALPGKDIRRFGGAWRALPETAWLTRVLPVASDVETLVENICHEELPAPSAFSDIYIWNLSARESLWVVPRRALRRLKHLTVEAAAEPSWRAYPEGNQPFSLAGGTLSLDRRGCVAYRDDAVLGRHIILRVGMAVRAAESNVRVWIR